MKSASLFACAAWLPALPAEVGGVAWQLSQPNPAPREGVAVAVCASLLVVFGGFALSLARTP